MPFDPLPATERTVYQARLHELADFIESCRDHHFDMLQPHCGTAGCIAGFAAWRWPQLIESVDGYDTWFQTDVAAFLGLTERQSDQLFFFAPGTDGDLVSFDEIDRTRAARCLRRLAATGRVQF